MARTPAMVQAELLSLPAEGWALPREADSNWGRALLPLATELARFEVEAEALLAESDPRAADDLLAEWEATFGLPDTCRPNESFSRASSATYFDGNGVLRVAVVNEPRFLFDSAGRVTQARILEQAATNLQIQSNAPNAADFQIGANVVDLGAVVAPDGNATARRLRSGPSGPANVYIARATRLTIPPSTSFALSLFARLNAGSLATATGLTVDEYDAGGIFLTRTGTMSLLGVTGSWSRFSRSFTTRADCASIMVYWADNWSVGAELDVWGFQVEAGGQASSLILTGATAATRAPDLYRVATQAERRQRLVQQLTVSQGQNPGFFVSLAASLGIAVTIDEFHERSCESDCEVPAYDPDWVFAWRVNAPLSANTTSDRTVEDDCETPLVNYGDNTLECLIRRLAPGHTTVLFAYS